MRTISYKWPGHAPRGDHTSLCDYCGVKWRRSQLVRDGSGLLRCPDEGNGRDIVTLSRIAEQAARKRAQFRRSDGQAPEGETYESAGSLAIPGPLEIVATATPVFYYRADLVTLGSGNQATAWPSQVSPGQYLRRFTTKRAIPEGGPGGRRALSFQRSSYFEAPATSQQLAVPAWVFAVLRQTEWASGRHLLNGSNAGAMALVQGSEPGILQMRNPTAVNANRLPMLTWGAVAMSFTGSTSDYLRIGSTVVTGASAGSDGRFGNRIGFPTDPPWLDIAELGGWLGTPSDEEIERIFGQYVPDFYGL